MPSNGCVETICEPPPGAKAPPSPTASSASTATRVAPGHRQPGERDHRRASGRGARTGSGRRARSPSRIAAAHRMAKPEPGPRAGRSEHLGDQARRGRARRARNRRCGPCADCSTAAPSRPARASRSPRPRSRAPADRRIGLEIFLDELGAAAEDRHRAARRRAGAPNAGAQPHAVGRCAARTTIGPGGIGIGGSGDETHCLGARAAGLRRLIGPRRRRWQNSGLIAAASRAPTRRDGRGEGARRRAAPRAAIVIERKAGRAGARHADELRARRRRPAPRASRAIAGASCAAARLHIVAPALERRDRGRGRRSAARRGEGGAAGRIAPGARPSPANTAAVDTGDPGIGEHGEQRRAVRAAGPSRSPRPAITRARGARQTGTSAPTARAAARTGARRRRRGRSHAPAPAAPPRRRRAAAEPRRDRQVFVKREPPEPQPGHALGEGARGAQDEIVVAAARRRRRRPVDLERQRLRPASKPSQSPQPAKATRLSSSCHPSARRPRTCSVRLTLAGARQSRGESACKA